MDRTLYAVITHHCNLKCPHCFLKDSPEEFNEELFLEKINNYQGRIILFGGEPTFYKDRMFKIIDENQKCGKSIIDGITTNLIRLDENYLNFYKKIGRIGSSWNLDRFTDQQYELWKQNCETVANAGVGIGINITLTPDLINYDKDKFLEIVDEWKHLSSIRFEQLVFDELDDDHFKQVDEWLCDIKSKWRSDIHCITFNQKSWYFDCKGVHTLYPDGTLRVGCPNSVYVPRGITEKCLSCSKSAECMPCNLQRKCSRPSKLLASMN